MVVTQHHNHLIKMVIHSYEKLQRYAAITGKGYNIPYSSAS
jgi:hypothetical protein